MASVADDKNLSYITCRSPFNSNEIDHIIFPNEGISFSVSNNYLPLESINLYADDFIKFPLIMPTVYDDIYIEHAISHSAKAKVIHDEIEDIYQKAMDFKEVDKISEYVLEFFFN